MAQTIGNLDVSRTFPNVLLSNVSAPAGTDIIGIPEDLLNDTNRVNARVQDGSGTPSPLHISKTDVGISTTPQTLISITRITEVLESMTQAQNSALIF
jgi:hypothetical protein